MSLVERAQAIRERLRNPADAVDDDGIDLKRKPKERPPSWTLKIGPITHYQGRRTCPAPEDVTRIVCEHYGVSPDELQSVVRTQVLVRPRQVWAYLAKETTDLSFPQIGRYLGGRDHTTQVHAHNKIKSMMEGDAAFAAEIDHLKTKLARLFDMRRAVVCFDPREF